jgi:hypothetical protein
MLNTIIQIILSFFLIAIMALISYSIYNKEILKGIKVSNTTKKVVKVFDGIFSFGSDIIEQETYNKSHPTYLDINPSINQNGGAEYSYNFWLYFNVHNGTIIKSTSYSGTSPEIESNKKYKYAYINLFYKGEPESLLFKSNSFECDNIDVIKLLDKKVLIKNPLVKIRNDASEIIVEYNNINFPETYNSSAKLLTCNDNEYSLMNRNKNKFGIKNINVDKIKKKYNMITIVFQENPENENIINSNKANCRVYFNSELVSDRVANINNNENVEINEFKSRVMKSNFSKLRVNDYRLNLNHPSNHPKVQKILDTDSGLNETPLKMADLTYYNYSLNQMEINSLYKAGFNKYDAILTNVNADVDKYIKGSNSRSDKDLPEPI